MNILVSACLLGMCCRYDGKEKRQEEVIRLMKYHTLIPVCPEQCGGLMTPRLPSERCGDRVVDGQGQDVTACFQKGAMEALKLAELYHCGHAILKERSPSCGKGRIYDGTFTGRLIDGDGVTAALLSENGIKVLGESRIMELCPLCQY